VVEPLSSAEVFQACPEEAFGFEVSSELESLDLLAGHERAREALAFGTAIRSDGFNLFVLGQPGHGKHNLVGRYLAERSSGDPSPPDWCYLYNFEDPSVPLYLQLPAGLGRQLRRDIETLVDELRGAIPAVFESDEYQNRFQELKQAMGERQRDAIEAVRREAREQGIVLLSTPNGFTFAPADGDKMMSPEDYEKLPKEERERIEHTVEICSASWPRRSARCRGWPRRCASSSSSSTRRCCRAPSERRSRSWRSAMRTRRASSPI